MVAAISSREWGSLSERSALVDCRVVGRHGGGAVALVGQVHAADDASSDYGRRGVAGNGDAGVSGAAGVTW